jgi:lipid A 3-O-deacylase
MDPAGEFARPISDDGSEDRPMGKCLPASLAAALFLWALSCVAASAGGVDKSVGPFEILGDGRNYLDIGAGIFNWRNNLEKRSIAGRVEFRIGKKLAFVGPAMGMVANNEGFRYGYAGIYTDIAYGKFVLTPVLAMGIYRRGNSIDLGGPLEFRESLEIAYHFTDRCRVGVSVAHISNAHLYTDNPGQQDFLVSSSIGF